MVIIHTVIVWEYSIHLNFVSKNQKKQFTVPLLGQVVIYNIVKG